MANIVTLFQLLINAVKLYGTRSWFKVQQHVPGRTDVQCRERWINVLDPHLKQDPWSQEVDLKSYMAWLLVALIWHMTEMETIPKNVFLLPFRVHRKMTC